MTGQQRLRRWVSLNAILMLIWLTYYKDVSSSEAHYRMSSMRPWLWPSLNTCLPLFTTLRYASDLHLSSMLVLVDCVGQDISRPASYPHQAATSLACVSLWYDRLTRPDGCYFDFLPVSAISTILHILGPQCFPEGKSRVCVSGSYYRKHCCGERSTCLHGSDLLVYSAYLYTETAPSTRRKDLPLYIDGPRACCFFFRYLAHGRCEHDIRHARHFPSDRHANLVVYARARSYPYRCDDPDIEEFHGTCAGTDWPMVIR